jgi:hypothetical protein
MARRPAGRRHQAADLASKVISHRPQHSFLINRTKRGSMILAASRCSCWKCSRRLCHLATNAAEGGQHQSRRLPDDWATGRVCLAGDEAEIRNARDAAAAAQPRKALEVPLSYQ